MNSAYRVVPLVAVGLAAIYMILMMLPTHDELSQDVGPLLVMNGGRFQPLDTYARSQMLLMCKRQEYEDVNGKSQPAVRWLMDTLAMGLARYYQQSERIPIEDPEVLAALGLQARSDKGNLFLAEEIAEKPQFQKETERVFTNLQQRKKPNDLDAKIFRLAYGVHRGIQQGRQAKAIAKELDKRKTNEARMFRIESDQVLAILKLPRRSGLRYSWSEIMAAPGLEQFADKAEKAGKRPEKEWDVVDGKAVELERQLMPYREAEMLVGVLMVPPPEGNPVEDWTRLRIGLLRKEKFIEEDPGTFAVENLIRTYGMGDEKGFKEGLASYQQMLEKRYPDETRYARQEVWFNNFAPFSQCAVLYLVVFVMVCISWVTWPDVLNRTAFWLLIFTFAIHTGALIMRMYLQGRPPVTNLYSSAVFIGWGAVGLGLILERIYRLGVGNLVGAAIGFATVVISHHLARGGDTLEMMQAVLDTNFWLATHVVCVTLGYVATFVAGTIAIVYVIRGVFTTSLDRVTAKTVNHMIYGVVCFATLLSFVGTVLGGVWADQSWGRFWGWDPKENGALLIVAMNALILHARWSGLVRDRGIAVLAMAGNMITLWSWFGTNQLGIGLHAYGVNKTLVEVCRWGWLLQLGLIGVGLTPLKYWRSFQSGTENVPVRPMSRKPTGGPATAITR